MKQIIQKVDALIDKIIEMIPGHIRDIIRKASYALLGIILLLAVTVGIRLGVRDAQPGGMQLSGSSRELLYLQELRHENQKRQQLFEDVEVDPMQFPSRQREATLPFAELGRDTSDRLLGERDELLQNPDFLRPKEQGPTALDDDIFSPRRIPGDSHEIKEPETESLLSPRGNILPNNELNSAGRELPPVQESVAAPRIPSRPGNLNFLE